MVSLYVINQDVKQYDRTQVYPDSEKKLFNFFPDLRIFVSYFWPPQKKYLTRFYEKEKKPI